jgi:hypothetical protein
VARSHQITRHMGAHTSQTGKANPHLDIPFV